MMHRNRRAAVIGVLSILIGACSSGNAADTTSTTAPEVTTLTETSTTPVEPRPSPSAQDITLPAELRPTPRQAEGPYYPVTKPDDRDNDLLVLEGSAPTTIGTPLEISGLLVYDDGAPVRGAVVEIWQVDGQGIYDHPRAPNTDGRDRGFQFYGEAVTDGAGFWTFLTLDPVVYETRPRHIHVKVRVEGTELLTTQIYFDGDPLLDRDGIANSAGSDLELLTTNAAPGTLSNGLDGLVARHLIVLSR